MNIKKYKQTPKSKNWVEIEVEVDVNDGDYVTNTEEFSVEEFEKIYYPILKKIFDNNGDYDEKGEYLNKDEIHTIEDCQLFPKDTHTVENINFYFYK